MDQFFVDTMQTALSLDSLTSSHPVSVTVNDPTEINEIFDSISYDKVMFCFTSFCFSCDLLVRLLYECTFVES